MTFTRFRNTDSSTSTQVLTAPFIGDNFISVKCEDEVGNEDRKNASFNLVIDSSAPFISRLFEKTGKMNIKTDEDSICYYSFNKLLNCFFDISNATLLSGLYNQNHDVLWEIDKTYYLRCKDFYGNVDNGCNKIVKTY